MPCGPWSGPDPPAAKQLTSAADLQAVAEMAKDRWSLALGEPVSLADRRAWVAPVRRGHDDRLVLKVAPLGAEDLHEAHGLRVWGGDGTVRLHEVFEADGFVAMLLERCAPGTALRSRPEPDQDIVIAGLARRLWRSPPEDGPFRPLQQMCDMWAAEFDTEFAAHHGGLDPGLAQEGIALFRELPATATRHVLLHTDLHAGNVLSSDREPWLVIDPKPYVGDPTYDLVQHMLNCDDRLRTDPQGLVRRLADLAELDAERLLLWLFARCVQEAPGWPGLADVARAVAPA